MDWRNFISTNPKVLYGKPAIKGTRIAVDLILEKLSEGETTENLLVDYPDLNAEQISACLAFASDHIRNESVYPLAS